MEQKTDITTMLDLMLRPAFSVKDGLVDHINQAAESLCLTVHTPIDTLLETGAEDYSRLTDGCLYLTLRIGDNVCGASVTKLEGFDIFLLELDDALAQLQAMALAARELREPLGNIMIAAERISPLLEDNEDNRTMQYTARLNRATHQLLRLICNMSDAARYTAESDPRVELKNISAVCNEAFEKAAALVEQAGMTLCYKPLHEEIVCLIDAERIERAVYNLISNAVKFSPKGSTVHASLARHGDRVHLTVEDSGCGVRHPQRGSVFSRYLRQPCIEDGLQGIGLGMVIVRAAATSHGGTVLIEQPEKGGTRITATFRINRNISTDLRSPVFLVDYAGEKDHGLLELSDTLPAASFENI